MVKERLGSFFGGSKSPYAVFSIKKAVNNWRLLLGQQEGRVDSMANPENGKWCQSTQRRGPLRSECESACECGVRSLGLTGSPQSVPAGRTV